MIIVWHQEDCRVMTNGHHDGRICLSHTLTNDAHNSIAHFHFNKAPEVPKYADISHYAIDALF